MMGLFSYRLLIQTLQLLVLVLAYTAVFRGLFWSSVCDINKSVMLRVQRHNNAARTRKLRLQTTQ